MFFFISASSIVELFNSSIATKKTKKQKKLCILISPISLTIVSKYGQEYLVLSVVVFSPLWGVYNILKLCLFIISFYLCMSSRDYTQTISLVQDAFYPLSHHGSFPISSSNKSKCHLLYLTSNRSLMCVCVCVCLLWLE